MVENTNLFVVLLILTEPQRLSLDLIVSSLYLSFGSLIFFLLILKFYLAIFFLCDILSYFPFSLTFQIILSFFLSFFHRVTRKDLSQPMPLKFLIRCLFCTFNNKDKDAI